MNIAITGATGYIAQNLIVKLESVKHTIVKIARKELYNPGDLLKIMPEMDTVIHLAGSPILRKWTENAREEILSSRITTTANLVEVINQLPAYERPKTFISASAVGIYSPGFHTEKSTEFADDFTGTVAKQWEAASEPLNHSVRRVIFRIGVVIGKESATMQKMLPVFKSGFGGKIASGNQPFPFVHIDDVVNSLFWACQNKEVSGVFNLAAPQNIDNNHFTKALAKKLRRPAIFSVPESALKLLYGEAASLITSAPQVFPERLLEYGYRFKYPDIDGCLDEIIASANSGTGRK